MHKSIRTIAIAGSGNIAWHLANVLKLKNYQVSGIWSRDYSNALALAQICGSTACKDISSLCENTDMIIIAVADNAISEVSKTLGKYNGIVVHTAGSVSMLELKGSFKNRGVLYPLQTLTKGTPVIMSDVPFFVEASSSEVLQAIKQVALSLSAKVYEADSKQRMNLHVAAVFASNYSNFMYVIGNELLKKSDLPQEALHTLITETARKAVTADPLNMQTGPARRNDTHTLAKHIKTLASMPEYAELYQLLANMISNKYRI